MKVSIITVCYNSSKTILETITSVNNQTYPDIEHVFIDGGSTDNTLKIIKSYSIREFELISETDDGIYDGMNKGIFISSGDIIMILNSDDILYDNFTVEKIVEQFKSNDFEILYGNIKVSKQNNLKSFTRIWEVSKFERGSFKNGWHPPHPGLIIRKSTYQKHGVYKSELTNAADFELMLRFFEKINLKCQHFNEFVAILREGGESTNFSGQIRGMKDVKKAFRLNEIKPNRFYFTRRYLKKFIEKYLKKIN